METKEILESIRKANENARINVVISLKTEIFNLDEYIKSLLIKMDNLETRKKSLKLYRKERAKIIKNTSKQTKDTIKSLLTKKDKDELEKSWFQLEQHVLY